MLHKASKSARELTKKVGGRKERDYIRGLLQIQIQVFKCLKMVNLAFEIVENAVCKKIFSLKHFEQGIENTGVTFV